MTQTYVYNGKEVYLTGRKAIKSASTRRKSEKILYEIKLTKYKDISEWVELKDLYTVMDDVENTQEVHDDMKNQGGISDMHKMLQELCEENQEMKDE